MRKQIFEMEQVVCVEIWYVHVTLLCIKQIDIFPLQMEELEGTGNEVH